MELDNSLLKKAYKKLKSSVYFDKTQLVLRDLLVQYEGLNIDLDYVLEELWTSFKDKDKWSKLTTDIMDSIDVLIYPKSLKLAPQSIIFNSVSDTIEIDALQYFINMDVRGHILGVLWLLMIGWQLDEKIYEHSYGNRIRKKLVNDMANGATYSPYLFEPYFEQYESWRDTALSDAKKCLNRNQDVVILTMDFRRFYYSVDMTEKVFNEILNTINIDSEDICLYERINYFIYQVIATYSKKYNDGKEDGLNILPIGFLPSNVLANWCLKNFDKAIIDGWNPIYYGRYVDDILIVDKVEKNSDIFTKAKNHSLSRTDIIKFFLEQCTKWKGFIPGCENSLGFSPLIEDKELIITDKGKDKDIRVYKINPIYNIAEDTKTQVTVQDEKVKIFYFKSGESDALLTCFKNNISNNKSEFRFMPEDEAVFQEDDYSEIYNLKESESINKLRGVDGISIDKFALSKFLGKYLRIGGLVNDKLESKFEKDISKIFNARVVIENYTTWEKVIEIFVINNKFNALYEFVNKIINSINCIQYSENINKVENIQISLLRTLRSAIIKSFSINWGKQCEECIRKIYLSINMIFSKHAKHFNPDIMMLFRNRYCVTRMSDKYVMPIMIDAFIIDDTISFNEKTEINLTNFIQAISKMNEGANLLGSYKYYPYMVTMYDLSTYYAVLNFKNKTNFNKILEITKLQKMIYLKCNYVLDSEKLEQIDELIKVHQNNSPSNPDKLSAIIKIGNSNRDSIRFAIANVRVSHKNFERVVKDIPNRSYKRYKDLSLIVNHAIKENVDMLVMPECYIPFEWLPTISRTCAKNQLGIVAGIEHVKIENKVYNLTAVILPYKEDDYKSAFVSFHLKKHYAPLEIQEIEGYRLEPVTGQSYELYCWYDCWFPVYCCYELASIKDRALFQSYADLLIAVEWNSDTNYYSNILESLSRDLHCYCVQVNSSNYGDSRITKPSKTEDKDIIRTKGGINSTILIDEIDIKSLRDFQFKEFELQKQIDTFKPTPPEFNRDIVALKMQHKLWDKLSQG